MLLDTASGESVEGQADPIIQDFYQMRLMATMQALDKFWTCGQQCADKDFPIMWFTPIHPSVSQALLMKNGGWGLLSNTQTWWRHVPAGGRNLEWMDVWSCGAFGLKNPKFSSWEKFHRRLLATMSDARRKRLECARDAALCPNSTRFEQTDVPKDEEMCHLDGDLRPVWTEGARMTQQQTWRQHAELRAVVGKLRPFTPEDLIPNHRNNESKQKHQWLDLTPWEGPSHWPDDPFVAGLFSFNSQTADWKPSLQDIRKITENHTQLHHTCCALVTSAYVDTFCKHTDQNATYPMYMYWQVGDMPQAKDLEGLGDWSSLRKVDGLELKCSVDTCRDFVGDENLPWLHKWLVDCDEKDRRNGHFDQDCSHFCAALRVFLVALPPSSDPSAPPFASLVLVAIALDPLRSFYLILPYRMKHTCRCLQKLRCM